MARTSLGRELHVVRLDTGGREVHDGVGAARDLVDGPCERIEGRDHRGDRDRMFARPSSRRARARRGEPPPYAPAHGSTSLRTGIIITMPWTDTTLARLRESTGRERRGEANGRRAARPAGLLPVCAGDTRRSARDRRPGRHRERLPRARRDGRSGASFSESTSATVWRATSRLTTRAITTILVCDDCGKVEPFEDAELESAIERVAGGRGYSVAAHDVVLRGACEDCRHHGD